MRFVLESEYPYDGLEKLPDPIPIDPVYNGRHYEAVDGRYAVDASVFHLIDEVRVGGIPHRRVIELPTTPGRWFLDADHNELVLGGRTWGGDVEIYRRLT